MPAAMAAAMARRGWIVCLLLPWLWAVLSVAAKPAAPAADDPVLEARMLAVAAELRCLVCQNQTIADSTAALAVDLKRQISEQISAGKTDDEIKDYMLERYGEFVLYDPPFNAKNAALWSLPFLLMLIAFGVAWRTYKANQKAGEVKGGGSAPRALSSKRLKELESQYRNSGEG